MPRDSIEVHFAAMPVVLLHMFTSPEKWCVVECLRQDADGVIPSDILQRVLGLLQTTGLVRTTWPAKCAHLDQCPPQPSWQLTELGLASAIFITGNMPPALVS